MKHEHACVRKSDVTYFKHCNLKAAPCLYFAVSIALKIIGKEF